MSETSETGVRPRRRRSRILLGASLLVLVVVAGIWVARRPIAEGFIDRELAKAGVPARYGIADFGIAGQRLTNVVLGDPANPDLVADWVETRTGVGLSGPYLAGVRAGHVRIRGRLVDGRVSLGAIDRLLPAPSGKPFALPALDVDVADARMRLETPQGLVGLKLSGSGVLSDGFRGSLAAVSDRIATGGCVASGISAVVRVRIVKERPNIVGPMRAARVACGTTQVAALAATVDLGLSAALDRWKGTARLATGAARAPGVALGAVGGMVAFDGSAVATGGTLDLTGTGVRADLARASRLQVAGAYRIAESVHFDGTVRADRGAVVPRITTRVAGMRGSAAGTPVAPLVDAAVKAVAAASRDFGGEGAVSIRVAGNKGTAIVSRLSLASASGARIGIAGGSGVTIGWPAGSVRLDTALTMRGGGLPTARVSLAQDRAGAPVRGVARMSRYSAGGASLALTPVTFSATPGGATAIRTTATLDGPLGDGRIDGATLPVTAHWDGRGRIVVNPECAPFGFQRLAISGLVVAPARIALCPVDGAVLRVADGRVGGGVRVAATTLSGRLGTTPVALDLSGASLQLADRGFVVEGARTRIGAPERVTRLDFARIDGSVQASGIGGRFTGGGGQIANVPLLLGAAEGDWALAGGALKIAGAMIVSDASPSARFKPMAARGVTLSLVNGTIAAAGTLFEPTRSVKVADVTLVHALGAGNGHADLSVPGIAFAKDGLQPDALTLLTYGVIADVAGSVSGEGHIAWTGAGVTSTGVFRTAGTDLAAAFGPVTGIATEVRFTDLLNLQSAPGQVATIRTLNPGIPVNDGTIRYATLPGARVQVEGGRWPFAGGTLTLDPTLLDFSAPKERRMTFHVEGMAADQFLQQFDFKNLDATGVFDGVLPMIFDEKGGRIEGGDLKVRPGGGTIAYVGDLSQKDLGMWANIAFQALKSLRYRSLRVGMNGPLAGEMVTDVRFEGVSQGAGAKSNFLVRRLQRLPFVFNIRIAAPFRGLIDSAQSFYDPKRLLLRPPASPLTPPDIQAPAIQATESRTVP